jgi:hypothetical protein
MRARDRWVAAIASVVGVAGLIFLVAMLLIDGSPDPAPPGIAAQIATTRPAAVTRVVEIRSAVAATRAVTDAATSTAASVAVTDWLQQFAAEPWFETIERVDVASPVVTFVTTLEDDDTSRTQAIEMCERVSDFVYGRDGRPYRVSAIEVHGQNDMTLAQRRSILDRCG